MSIEIDIGPVVQAYGDAWRDERTTIIVESFLWDAADFVFEAADDDIQDVLDLWAGKTVADGIENM